MSSTNFSTGTVIASTWLNDVNNSVYNGVGPNSVPGSTVQQYTQGGTNSITRPVSKKLQESISVLDFIDPTNAALIVANTTAGQTSSTVTAAINAALAASSCVYFPAGTYLVDGNININSKSIIGNSKYTTTIKLSGTNTNTPLLINGGSTSTSWGSGGQFLIKDIALSGNWDGSTNNTGTNLSNVGALIQFFGGTEIKIQNCRLGSSYGFGVMCYLLGYSDIEDTNIFACALNGVHWYGASGSAAITTSGIHNSTITTCGRYGGSSNILGSSGIYLREAFMVHLDHTTIEDATNAVTLDGNDNRSNLMIACHTETNTNGFNYIGAGTNLTFINNIFATGGIAQTNPVVQQYTAIGNFEVSDVYNLPYTTGSGQVNLTNSAPQTTIASITLSPGTYLIVGTWMGTASSGLGQMSTRQQFGINLSASLPTYNNFKAINNYAYYQADCASDVNTANGFANGSLSLITNITSTQTYYLYGGPTSITSSLNVVCTGYLTATKVNGAYIFSN